MRKVETDLQRFCQMLKQSQTRYEVLDILHAIVVGIDYSGDGSEAGIFSTFDRAGKFVGIGATCAEHGAAWPPMHGCRVCGAPCTGKKPPRNPFGISCPEPLPLQWATELRAAANGRLAVSPQTMEMIATYLEDGRLPSKETLWN